jgi:hypothetical protein
MKKLFILVSLILIGCAGLSASDPIDIHVSELEIAEAVECVPQGPLVHMHFFRIRGTVAVAMVSVARVYLGLIGGYVYLDNDQLIAYKLDMAAFAADGTKRYVVDLLTTNEIEYVYKMLIRVKNGLKPIEIEPQKKLDDI